MAEKTDEEIIKEVGLETTNDVSNEDALAALSFDNETSSNTQPQVSQEIDELEELVPVNSDSPNQNSDSTENSQEQNSVIQNEDKDDETEKVDSEIEEEIPVQKKQPKIYRILMIVVAVLASILVIGLIMYFIGFFDPEEPEVKPMVKAMDKQIEMKMDDEIEFNEKAINKDKLNRKLTALTKTEGKA